MLRKGVSSSIAMFPEPFILADRVASLFFLEFPFTDRGSDIPIRNKGAVYIPMTKITLILYENILC